MTLFALVCVLPSVLVALPQSPELGGQAEDTPLSAPDESARWSFTLEPFLWLAGIEGDGSVDSSPPTDIGENLSLFGEIDGGFLLAGEARAPDGRFSLFGDGLYLSLADSDGSLQTDTDVWMLELGAGLPLGRSSLEAIAGLRYVDLEFATEVTGFPGASAHESWIDPWVGARGGFELGERWELDLRADVGGFGVGCEFTWQALGGLRVDLGKSVRLDLGYRAIRLDFDDDDLEYDALIRGPVVGLAFGL